MICVYFLGRSAVREVLLYYERVTHVAAVFIELVAWGEYVSVPLFGADDMSWGGVISRALMMTGDNLFYLGTCVECVVRDSCLCLK